MRFGIMQGRLVAPEGSLYQCFPRTAWAEEFPRAKEAGLDAIEWIYDVYGEDMNPIASAAGLDKMRALTAEHGVETASCCADWFMERPLVKGTAAERAERLDRLKWLIVQLGKLKMERVVLPFVDASKLETQADLDALVPALSAALPTAEAAGVELHLETDLDPERFAALLARLPSKLIWVNYDSGNSSSLGYAPREEFAAYGQRVGSVHIKDRVLHGKTAPLGTGDADFDALFESLKKVDYCRDFILQAARQEIGGEVALARHNRAFADRWLK